MQKRDKNKPKQQQNQKQRNTTKRKTHKLDELLSIELRVFIIINILTTQENRMIKVDKKKIPLNSHSLSHVQQFNDLILINMIFLYLPDHEYIFLYYNVLIVNSKCVICYLYLLMITQELVRQVTKEQDNNRVYKADLSNKLITRISGLRPFSKLRCLILNFNHIRAMENLEYLPDLRQLHLQNNQITSLCGLQNNKMLTLLNLTENSIEKIQNIGHLIKLQTLMIDNNRIEKVVGLQTLKDLKYLSISGNKLSSIDSLPAFSKLQVLNAEKNMIKKISPLTFAKSNKLLRLNLAQNLLDDVSFVNSLTSLEQLNISHNNISKLQFSILKNLEYLNISNNKIDQLPKIALIFPQLSTFLFANNQIRSQFQLIQSLAEAEMIVEVDFRGNTMATPEFADTLYKLYGYDRINQKNYNKPGTRYLSKAQQIQKIIHDEGMGEIENDEDVRKIMMSGFYNDDLEEQMTGVKPDRPSSGTRTRLGPSLNFQEMQKSYNQIIRNQKRYETLRKQCLQIFENNNIVVNVPRPKIEDQQSEQMQSSRGMMTQVKNLTENTNTISELQTRNEENANKWKELKNRQKNFNIRGLVRKMSNSQKKPGPLTKEGSLNKIPSPHERSQLMKTQLNPPRWNNDPSLMRTMQSRPFSAKKKDK